MLTLKSTLRLKHLEREKEEYDGTRVEKKGKEDESDSSAETVEMLTVGSLRLWAHLFGHGEENVVTRVLYAASGKNCRSR